MGTDGLNITQVRDSVRRGRLSARRRGSTGAGLGNAFLSHISAVDGIFHVVRAFPNEEVIHEEGEIDPIRDIEIINGELIAKDL